MYDDPAYRLSFIGNKITYVYNFLGFDLCVFLSRPLQIRYSL